MLQVSLIALDVDGTLLTDSYTISIRTKRVIQQALAEGVKVILATGRNPRSCYPLVEELNLVDPIITHNGAVIVDPITKQASRQLGFSVHDMRQVIQFCKENQLQFDLNSSFDMYIDSLTPAAKGMYEKFFATPTKVDNVFSIDDVIVKFSIFAEEELLDLTYPQLERLCSRWRIIRSGECFIDIIHPEATKGFALQHLLTESNLNANEVIAFGNYYNDLEMLQMVGLGVAMENSPDDLKKLADKVTKSNNEDGVAIVLEEIFNNIECQN